MKRKAKKDRIESIRRLRVSLFSFIHVKLFFLRPAIVLREKQKLLCTCWNASRREKRHGRPIVVVGSASSLLYPYVKKSKSNAPVRRLGARTPRTSALKPIVRPSVWISFHSNVVPPAQIHYHTLSRTPSSPIPPDPPTLQAYTYTTTSRSAPAAALSLLLF